MSLEALKFGGNRAPGVSPHNFGTPYGTYEYGKIMSKYSIHNPGSCAAELKSSLWRHFVDTVF